MRRAVLVIFVVAAGCRGESPPRDYQNNPAATMKDRPPVTTDTTKT